MAEYAERDTSDLEPHYSRHVNAMTEEDLRRKSEIAAELAYRDKRIADLETSLHEIQRWCKAYPIAVFPEMLPADWKQVAALLDAGGYTLDRISASNMRQVLTRLQEHCEVASDE